VGWAGREVVWYLNVLVCIKTFKRVTLGVGVKHTAGRNGFLPAGMVACRRSPARKLHLGLPGGAAGAMDARTRYLLPVS